MSYNLSALFITLLLSINLGAQDNTSFMDSDYFRSIPDYPEQVSDLTVFLRMVEGLGYRYYWASHDLREEDLSWRPSEDGRSTIETLEHILELTRMVRNAVEGQPNIRPVPQEELDYEALRDLSLNSLREISVYLRDNYEDEITNYRVIYQRGETQREFPFWHVINGPLSDALYHTGQIVAYRRASGNPIDPGVNVFMGKNR